MPSRCHQPCAEATLRKLVAAPTRGWPLRGRRRRVVSTGEHAGANRRRCQRHVRTGRADHGRAGVRSTAGRERDVRTPLDGYLKTRVANWGRGIGTTGYADTSDQDISELQLKFLECFTDKAALL
eukprot:scaffold20946_cov64-Phaeocystis_antarctica.AAC.4